jgi:2'-5' RNA ligase
MHDDEMASEPAEFWQQRNSLTPATDVATDVDSYRLVLLADTTDPTVHAEYKPVRDALNQFDCLNTVPVGSLHFTIKLFDVTVTPSTDGNWSPAVQQIDQIVAEALVDEDAFEATITQFNLFPDVVYGEAADGGRLAELNQAVCAHPEVTALDRDGDEFIPHLTFGYFESDTDFGALVDFLEARRQLSLPPIAVDEVELAAYEVGGRPPAYDIVRTYDLQFGQR